MRINNSGQIVWQKRFGGNNSERIWQILSLTNDQFLLIGTSSSGISGNKTEPNFGSSSDAWFIKIGADGEEIWQKVYGGTGAEFICKGVYDDGKIYAAITSDSPISGNKTVGSFGDYDIWVLILDLNGNILDQKAFGGSQIEQLSDMVLLNNHIIITCTSNSPISGNKTIPSYGQEDLWLLKLDKSLNITDEKLFGGSSFEDLGVMEVKNDYLYLSMQSSSGISGNKSVDGFGMLDNWLICLDTNLVEQYQYVLGGSQDEFPCGVYQKERGKLEVVIMSYSNISGNKTVNTYGTAATHWLVKLDVPLAVHEVTKSTGVNVYPNPFQSSFSIEMGEYHSFEKLEVLDMNGRILWTEIVKGKSSVKSESISNLDNGNYIYRLSGPNSHFVGKIVKILD
jgi:hypothetical protein